MVITEMSALKVVCGCFLLCALNKFSEEKGTVFSSYVSRWKIRQYQLSSATKRTSGAAIITAVTRPFRHGEGPHWDSNNQALYFVNTFDPAVLRLKDGKLTCQSVENTTTIGTVTPIAGSSTKFLITADRTVWILDWDGKSNNTGTVYYSKPLIANLEPLMPRNQANDGKADRLGRFWIGTLTRNPDLGVTEPGGCLYLINGCGHFEEKLLNVTISNGMAWNRNNTKFYYIDSKLRTISVFDYGEKMGDLSNPRTLFNLEDYTNIEKGAIADGMTIDSDDNLWVALYGGGAILHINSTDGSLIRKIDIPVTHVTSVTFGGANLDILYATTSYLLLNQSMLQEQPNAGSVFAITGLGVTGVPMYNYVCNVCSHYDSLNQPLGHANKGSVSVFPSSPVNIWIIVIAITKLVQKLF